MILNKKQTTVTPFNVQQKRINFISPNVSLAVHGDKSEFQMLFHLDLIMASRLKKHRLVLHTFSFTGLGVLRLLCKKQGNNKRRFRFRGGNVVLGIPGHKVGCGTKHLNLLALTL